MKAEESRKEDSSLIRQTFRITANTANLGFVVNATSQRFKQAALMQKIIETCFVIWNFHTVTKYLKQNVFHFFFLHLIF